MKKNAPELLYTLNDFRNNNAGGERFVILPGEVRRIAKLAKIKLVKGRKHPLGSLCWGIGSVEDWRKWLAASPFKHEEVDGQWCLVRRRVKPWPKVD